MRHRMFRRGHATVGCQRAIAMIDIKSRRVVDESTFSASTIGRKLLPTDDGAMRSPRVFHPPTHCRSVCACARR